MKRSYHYLLATLGLLVALSASPALAGGKAKFNQSSGANLSRSLNSNATKFKATPQPMISSNAARLTVKPKLQTGVGLSNNVGKFTQNLGTTINSPGKFAPRPNRPPVGLPSNLGKAVQLNNVGIYSPNLPNVGNLSGRLKLKDGVKISEVLKDGVNNRGPILDGRNFGSIDLGKGPVFGPGKGPIFDPPVGPIADPGNGNPPADPGNPPADPGQGNPPADPGNPPADPGNNNPPCGPPHNDHCPPHCPPNWGGGWGFPIPFPTWCGGNYNYNGGYCGTTTVVQPVYTQVSPAVQPAPLAIDLELVEVRQLDRGDPAQDMGPAYRVTIRNKTGEAVPAPFTVALAASIGRVPAADSAFAASRVNGLQAGQSLTVDVRLPAAAYKLGVNADGQPVAFTWLTAVVDSQMEVEQADRQNDFTTINRGEIVMAAVQQ